MRSIEQISHKLDGYAAAIRPEREVRRMHALSQAVNDDGTVRGDRIAGFVSPHIIPMDAIERGYVVDLDPTNIAAGAVGVTIVTVPGAEENDGVLVGAPPDLFAGLMVYAYVTGPNTVQLRILNTTGTSHNPGSQQWRFILSR